jgi:hypothetical protein
LWNASHLKATNRLRASRGRFLSVAWALLGAKRRSDQFSNLNCLALASVLISAPGLRALVQARRCCVSGFSRRQMTKSMK